MNQGVNKITKMTHPTNIRPDVIIVRKKGTIDFIEVKSKTDTKDLLEVRIYRGMENIAPSARGGKDVFDISEILEKK
ncbi:MAG TPA: hypothetical protein LFW20_01870 [Rickettsia endosymbiont of Omalisus fontisbellaquei]|nr:hypothetical protein [Rickettsia endosymbiont of Omalisus fontisbellaquei]